MTRRAVSQKGWKLVSDGKTEPWELYDLAADPIEQKDLAKSQPERVDMLKELWTKWAQKNNVIPLRTRGGKRSGGAGNSTRLLSSSLTRTH